MSGMLCLGMQNVFPFNEFLSKFSLILLPFSNSPLIKVGCVFFASLIFFLFLI
jgi:hypothetical protein